MARSKKIETQEAVIETPVDPESEFAQFFEDALKPEEENKIEETPVEEIKSGEENKPEEVPAEEVKPIPEESEADKKIALLQKEIEELKKVKTEPVDSAPTAPTGPSEEEKKRAEEIDNKLTEFQKNWPDHAEAMVLQQQLILSEVEKAVIKILEPVMSQLSGIQQNVNESEEDKMLNMVLSVHKDAVDLMPEIEAWIPTLPKYLQAGANHVLEEGTAQDVIDLIDDYKKMTGKVVVDTSPAKEEVPVEESPRLQAMVSPKSVRTGVSAGIDPLDFDGAFEAALKTV